MSSVRADSGLDDWRALVETMGRLHRDLLAKAEELQALLARPAYTWTVGDDVQGYLAPDGAGRLPAAEHAELSAGLRLHLEALRRLTVGLDELHALVQQPPLSPRADNP